MNLLKHSSVFHPRTIAIMGRESEIDRITHDLQESNWAVDIKNRIKIDDELTDEIQLTIQEILNFPKKGNVDELWVCLKNMKTSIILQLMTLAQKKLPIMVVGANSSSILGSPLGEAPGILNTIRIQYQIEIRVRRFQKRILELFAIPFLLILSPFLVIRLNISWLAFIREIIKVLFGRKLLVSYHPKDELIFDLPKLNKGIFYPMDQRGVQTNDLSRNHLLNTDYALHYSFWKDINILIDQLS